VDPRNLLSNGIQIPHGRAAVRSLLTDAAKTLVQAFISYRLDYCNSPMSGMADSLVRKVQSVHNAAARLVSVTTSRRSYVSYTGFRCASGSTLNSAV